MLITTEIPLELNVIGTEIAFWKLEESAETLYAEAEPFLTDDEKHSFATFKNERRRREWLATRLTVKSVLGHYPGIIYDGGKPHLGGQFGENKHISITHTDGLVGIAISDNPNIGIDLERMTPRILRIKHKFLNANEFDYIDGDGLSHLLYIQWCAKEAMYKAVNVNNYDYQNTYTLPLFRYDGSPNGIAKGRVIMDDGSAIYLDVKYFEIDGCMCCIAAK